MSDEPYTDRFPLFDSLKPEVMVVLAEEEEQPFEVAANTRRALRLLPGERGFGIKFKNLVYPVLPVLPGVVLITSFETFFPASKCPVARVENLVNDAYDTACTFIQDDDFSDRSKLKQALLEMPLEDFISVTESILEVRRGDAKELSIDDLPGGDDDDLDTKFPPKQG
jgi:hypothetical protein